MTTIYVAQPQTELKIQSRQLQVFERQRFCFSVPLNHVHQVIILGTHPWARKAIDVALSLHLPVLYFEPSGQCLEYLAPSALPAQYESVQWGRSRTPSFSHDTAESIVRAKLHNARTVLLHHSTQQRPAVVEQVLTLLQRLHDDLPLAPSLTALKTYEETGSALYRAALHRLLPSDLRHHNHGIRPLQRLLNLSHALLSQRIQLALQSAGLDTDIANLHIDALNRPPLVCDFLTELHVPLGDRLVLDLLTTQQIQAEDFIWSDQSIFLSPAALDTFVQHWDAHLSASLRHPYNGETTHNHCINLQIQDYIATLLDDQANYRPFLLMP